MKMNLKGKAHGIFQSVKNLYVKAKKSEDKSKDKKDKTEDKREKVLEPRIITNFSAINYVRRHKNLPEFSKSAENLYFLNNWDKLEDKDKLKSFVTYLENSHVNGILEKSVSDMEDDIGARKTKSGTNSKPVLKCKKECERLGILTKVGHGKYKVDDRKISEWREQ